MKVINSIALTLLGASLAVQADVVTDWNTAALNAIRLDRTSPPKASRALAILHVAIFDAMNGVEEKNELKVASYMAKGHAKAQSSEAAAASAAAHLVLVHLFPAQQATFDGAYAAALAAIPNGKSKNQGIDWGEDVAEELLFVRSFDRFDATVPLPSASGPGFWVSTPPAFAPYLLPQWGFVVPFTMASSHQFRPSGPPLLDSAKWAADYDEVKALGRATGSMRTPDQTEIALFWADGAGTETPPGHWNSIAQDVAAARGNTVDQNARLFALLNLAMADAAICAWDAKYHFYNWRPVTAIRNGDADGNPATEPDPDWSSLIGTPPFPDYVSGHSTFSAAAATVLALFYGTDHIAFDTGSDFLPGVARHFESFSAAAVEAALSRVYGGIHFRFASDDGLQAGMQIGAQVMQYYLRTAHAPKPKSPPKPKAPPKPKSPPKPKAPKR